MAGGKQTKISGPVGEYSFVVDATQHGLGVALPTYNNHPYDAIVDNGERLIKVQIKTASWLGQDGGSEYYHFNTKKVQKVTCDSWNTYEHYTADDFDILACYIIPLRLWYFIPSARAIRTQTLRIYPSHIGKRKVKRENDFAPFRNRWSLFYDVQSCEPSLNQLTFSETAREVTAND